MLRNLNRTPRFTTGLLPFLLSAITGCAATRFSGPESSHFDGTKFFNPGVNTDKSTSDLFRFLLSSKRKKWPSSVEVVKSKPPQKVESESEVLVTFVGHSTVLLQTHGLNILTDPVWSKRASPFSWVGPKRVKPPGIDFQDLPKIDVILVSHNHYDHLDLETLKAISKRDEPVILVPLGDDKVLKKAGINKSVVTLDWWETYQVSNKLKAHFTPSQHWSARGLFDQRRSLWGAFFLTSENLKIYFAGDTGYSDHFKEVSKRLGSPDLALLPIGAYEPRWFMKIAHMNPQESVTAHKDLGAKQSVAIHHGTFQLTDEGLTDPELELKAALKNESIPETEFLVLPAGGTLRQALPKNVRK